MKSSLFTAKTLEEALDQAKTSLNLKDEDFVYSYEEIKGKLFKSGSYNLSVYTLTDICDFLMNSCGVILGYAFLSKIRKTV